MKTTLYALLPATCLLIVSGCGLFGPGGVPDEQLDEDIAKSTVEVKADGYDFMTKWIFGADRSRCFSLNRDETKISPTNANVSITIASWNENMAYGISSAKNERPYETIFGKMILHYKKDGDKWVFESIEPKELILKGVGEENLQKFIEIVRPQCQYHIKVRGR